MHMLQTFSLRASAQLSVHLKSLRKARGLTQVDLGKRIGVKQTRIADIEKNPGAVGLDQLLQILHALDAQLLLADTSGKSHAPSPGATAAPDAGADW